MKLKRETPVTDTVSLWISFCLCFRAWSDQYKVLMIKKPKNEVTEGYAIVP